MEDPVPQPDANPINDVSESGHLSKPSSERLDVTVLRHSGDWQMTDTEEEKIAHLARVTVGQSGYVLNGRSELNIVLSSDSQVRVLNSTYRGKDAATNVLSFPSDGDLVVLRGEVFPLGDVVLAYETICREAAELDVSAVDHACHMAVHGVLHILGFDHDDDHSADVMEALESQILLAEGLHDPYADQTGVG